MRQKLSAAIPRLAGKEAPEIQKAQRTEGGLVLGICVAEWTYSLFRFEWVCFEC